MEHSRGKLILTCTHSLHIVSSLLIYHTTMPYFHLLRGFITLKLKTIHKYFLCPYKRQSSINALFHCIHIFTNTFQVTMQVNRDIHVEKTVLYKPLIYYEYMWLWWVFKSFGKICCLFSNCNKKSNTPGFDPYITLHLRCSAFLGVRTLRNAMKRSIEIYLL